MDVRETEIERLLFRDRVPENIKMNASPPDQPAGPLDLVECFDPQVRDRLIGEIGDAPKQLRNAVSGLAEDQLDTLYRNWSIRQITHHIADSHLHSIIRFKWALTESHPTIKAYEEGDWIQLADCRSGDVEPALALVDGLHMKWVQVLKSMSEDQYARTFFHPQSKKTVSLWYALQDYAWHGRHHTAQILWIRSQQGWEGTLKNDK